jgi:hypothetical protein
MGFHACVRHGAAAAGLFAVAVLAAGCAGGPPSQPAVERVDERTAVTVVTLPKPLLYSGARGALGQPLDLAVGPVEINRMGQKSWYLWVSLLGADLRDGDPHVRIVAGGERIVDLAPLPAEFAPPVSRAPYSRPADWASERYYSIPASDLARLHGRTGLAVEVETPAGERWRFEPWEASARDLDAYLERQLPTQLASR